jgi:ABC-type amino acid transport substrate-binding protein
VLAVTALRSPVTSGGSSDIGVGTTVPAGGENVLQKMVRTKKLEIGYAGYPPYLKKNVNSGEITGYSVDVARAILDPLDVKIQWVETSWDTMKQDVLLGKFDLMIEPIFMTIPRAAKVGFTQPYAYFGYGVLVVKKGETRFKTIEDVNNKAVTLAVTQGVASYEYAERNLTKANLKVIPGNDISITLSEVLYGKVDAALADVPTALEFLKAHKDQVDVLFVHNPPAITPAGFMTRPSQTEFIAFLNNALLYLQTNGTLDALDKKYELPSFREKKTFVAGSGLSEK